MIIFFFKQKTAYEMRISDWSSDVCSSDLLSDGRITDPGEIEPAGGRRRPGGGPITRLQCEVQILCRPAALADQLQRADEVAHLVVQEGARLGAHLDRLARTRDGEQIECLLRRLRLALAGPEGGEVVMAHQKLCGRMHRRGTEGRQHGRESGRERVW